MHPRRHQRSASASGIDGESLQADVMRFMAIIGFCLVAIMGLVREVSPPVQVVAVAGQEETAVAIQPVTQPKPKPEPRPQPQPQLEPVPVPVPVPAPVPVPVPELRAEAEPTGLAAAKPVEEGLTLRFNSDRDFLRLVSGGDVALYLFNSQRAFRLERDYALRETQSPTQLYELMPHTIPAGIRVAAERVVSDSADFNWGVEMPVRIGQQITRLVQTKTSGALVIDQFGSVRHEQAGPNSQTGAEEQG